MTRTFRMYRGQTVIANVLTDLGFRQLGGKKGQRLFSALTEETGLSLDPSRTISQMTITEQKMVELLRIFDQKPELLIIRGLSSFVSVDMFQKMMQLVERLNEAGVTVLYLTNRLEEAISLSFGITVVDKRRIQGTYSPEEIVSDPRSIFFISMGAQKFDFGEEPQPAPKPDALGYGIQENLQMFTRYLVREMSASSAAAFVLDPVQKRVLTSVGCASDASETVLLRDEAVCTLLGVDELVTLRPEQEAGWFERTPPYTTVLCYPVRISGELALVYNAMSAAGAVDGHRHRKRPADRQRRPPARESPPHQNQFAGCAKPAGAGKGAAARKRRRSGRPHGHGTVIRRRDSAHQMYRRRSRSADDAQIRQHLRDR